MRFTNLYYSYSYDDDDVSFHSSGNASLAAAVLHLQLKKEKKRKKEKQRSLEAIKSTLQMGLNAINAHTPSQCELIVLLYNLVG